MPENEDEIANDPKPVQALLSAILLLLDQENASLLVLNLAIFAQFETHGCTNSAIPSFGLDPLMPKFVPIKLMVKLPLVNIAAATDPNLAEFNSAVEKQND